MKNSQGVNNNNSVEHESNSYTNCHWSSWYSHQRFGKRTTGLGNKRMSGDNPNHSIIEIGQNTDVKKLLRNNNNNDNYNNIPLQTITTSRNNF